MIFLYTILLLPSLLLILLMPRFKLEHSVSYPRPDLPLQAGWATIQTAKSNRSHPALKAYTQPLQDLS